jgi:enamine deaminase RidA (YjgF/YER057c/UK114 family)
VKRIVSAEGVAAPPFAAPAVVADDWIFLSGQLATDWETGLAQAAHVPPGGEAFRPPVKTQIASIYKNIWNLLSAAGAGVESLGRVELFFVDRADVQRTIEERDAQEGDIHHPTSAALLVDRLVVPGALLQIDPIAFLPQRDKQLEAIDISGAALHARASFSKGMTFGGWVVTAGNVPRDSSGASVVAPEASVDPNYWLGSPIKEQTAYVVRRRLAEVLAAAGCGLDDVVRAQVYLTDSARDYAAFQEIWVELFPDRPPSTVVIPVSGLGLRGALVEISFVAARKGSIDVAVIPAEGLAVVPGHAPAAVQAGGIIWCSTVAALDDRGVVPEAADRAGLPFLEPPGQRQMRVILERLAAVLERAGSTLADLAKLTVYSSDLSQLPGFVELWRSAFLGSPPAISVVQVRGPILTKGCTVAVDAIALAGSGR